MKTFNTLDELIANINSLDWDGWIYRSNDNWNKEPDVGKYHYISEDELMESEEDEEGNPLLWKEMNVRPYFETETLKAVINNCKTGDYVKCINYYREYDSLIE